ncbi:MAG: hypothetical protein KC593_20000 [Myxococcales bacterium]|nr:hypothetical protein [Myxococcales bacterium]MCB9627262.1 hypothetical protein [Sandaracinaceae bacterium]
MSAPRPLPLPRRRPLLSLPGTLVLLACGVCLMACGGSAARPAADPDIRALQVHEARVTELAAAAQDTALPCAERRRAARGCADEAARAHQDLEGVRDADASARAARLASLCSAASATAEGQCGPDA